MLHLNISALDYAIIASYFLVVVGIGAIARLSVKTDVDFFLSRRTLPAWVTGLAFIAANLGALEILGQAANGAQYGIATVHFYWIGAVPAMVFLGLVMMPFYYGAKVRSVPEYLRLRFNEGTHAFNAATFAVGTVLIAGVNLFALALVLHLMIGWSVDVAILLAAAIVLVYVTLGGLRSSIYNEVLQFFVILASLIPLTIVGLHNVGGIRGLEDRIRGSHLGESGLHAWQGLGVGSHNSLGANWIGIVLGLGFVLSFGYWTTNFAEVQRALPARNMSAARRTPLIGAYPKIGESVGLAPRAEQRLLDLLVQERLDDLSGRLPAAVPVRTVLTWGPLGPALIAVAREQQAELIVVPMRRDSVLGHALHDHADRHVLHHSDVPVLVVPTRRPLARRPPSSIRPVV